MPALATVTAYAVRVAFLSLSVALVVLGSLNRDECPAQESLPIWMITAGSFNLVANTVLLVATLYRDCGIADKIGKNKSHSPKKKNSVGSESVCVTVTKTGTVLCVVVLAASLWLASWVAGTYFVMGAMGLLTPDIPQYQNDCDSASIAVSICIICLMWLVIVSRAIKVVVDLICRRRDVPAQEPTSAAARNLSSPAQHSLFYVPLQSGHDEKERRDSLLLSSLSTLV